MKASAKTTTRVRRPFLCLLVPCVLLAGGCTLLPKASVDPTRYYLLSATSTGSAASAATTPTIVLRPVDLASYLRSRPMLVRKGGNEIEFRDFARWGEPLELGIGRVLREELLAGGVTGVVPGGASRAGAPEGSQELTVRVLACEGSADGAVNFRAVWRLTKSDTPGAPLAGGDFRAADLRWDGKSEAALAAQLSRAVSGLAAEISAALKK